MSGTQKSKLPNKRGYLNTHSGTWHYLERCTGAVSGVQQMRLPEAVEQGHKLCGNCCSRFGWYVQAETDRDGGVSDGD